MKLGKMDARTHYLPEEIIRSILSRLPAKSLIRFQCVSKQWKTTIETPSFIADHLRHQSPCPLIPGKDGLHLLDCEMQVPKLLVLLSEIELESASIVGSCNGLLCLETVMDPPAFLLWNPLIQELRWTPRANGAGKGMIKVGFGFSPIINDYKIVVVCIERFPLWVVHVEVYSLTSGSWKVVVVEHEILKGICLKSASVTGNGVVFWHGAKGHADMIVLFDIALESFTLIPWPTISQPNCSYRLVVYENKLAMLIKNRSFECSDLWVMDEGDVAGSDGERWSWTKKYNTPFPSDAYPLMIWKNEIVCYVIENADFVKFRIALFNVTTSELKMTGMRGFECIGYVESLVPVGGGGGKEVECNIFVGSEL
ncbi:unnamed protein product [Cuscuta campestris]|uniref:F-box domain-containing protein n=1 Tax=Cuscuta campestris TaxID=132261 RepID=A0A484KS89_9ASTE|nr:unnamed protein product [Cuscuta campestris]